MENNLKLAIIIPCFNEETIIEESINSITAVLNELISNNLISKDSYISVIDDGSYDSSWEKISEIASSNKHIKGIRLLYNSGHQNALMCGLKENDADIFITVDCDLQDDINVIKDMVKKYMAQDIEVVYGVNENRDSDSFVKKITAQMYYKILSFIGIKTLYNSADFRLISKNVTSLLKQIDERNLYLRGLIYNYNFKHDTVYYKRNKRIGGYAKYNFLSSLDLAIKGITNQSLFPIRCIFVTGILLIILSALNKSLLIAMTALILISLGTIGEYLGRMFTEIKKHPNYMIKEKNNY